MFLENRQVKKSHHPFVFQTPKPLCQGKQLKAKNHATLVYTLKRLMSALLMTPISSMHNSLSFPSVKSQVPFLFHETVLVNEHALHCNSLNKTICLIVWCISSLISLCLPEAVSSVSNFWIGPLLFTPPASLPVLTWTSVLAPKWFWGLQFYSFCFVLFFWLSLEAYEMLVPPPGTELSPLALEVQGLNPWTTREVPALPFSTPFFTLLLEWSF